MIGVPVDRWLGGTLHSVAATAAQHAGRPVGRVAVLRARLAVHRHPEPQHVHADRHRHRGRLPLQPRRRAVSRRSFPTTFQHHGTVRSLLRGGGGDRHAGPARDKCWSFGPDAAPEPPFGNCCRWPRRPPASCETARNGKCRWKKSTRATSCEFVPARRFRSMASSRTARARSMSR